MDTISFADQIMSQLHKLTPEQQKRVLDFTLSLTPPVGESGKHLVESLSHYHIDAEDLAEMQRVIEADCERIDLDGWDRPIFPD